MRGTLKQYIDRHWQDHELVSQGVILHENLYCSLNMTFIDTVSFFEYSGKNLEAKPTSMEMTTWKYSMNIWVKGGISKNGKDLILFTLTKRGIRHLIARFQDVRDERNEALLLSILAGMFGITGTIQLWELRVLLSSIDEREFLKLRIPKKHKYASVKLLLGDKPSLRKS